MMDSEATKKPLKCNDINFRQGAFGLTAISWRRAPAQHYRRIR